MSVGLILIGLLGWMGLYVNLQNTRISLVKGIVFFSLLTLMIAETLSLFHSLNYFGLVLSWSITDILLIYLIIKKQPEHLLTSLKDKCRLHLKNLSSKEKWLVGFTIFIIIAIFAQGIIYPPNNWDSMAYHMPRIIEWIQHESLQNFRTPVYPQLNSPPFAEQLTMQINLLAGNDYFSNTVQWFYLIGTAIAISCVSKLLKLNRLGQLLSIFIFICLPEVILLGSSTHTELSLSFFMVVAISFLITTAHQQRVMDFLLLGISLGLAAATKNTAYIYLTPFVLIWAGYALYRLLKSKGKRYLLYYLVIPVVFVLINSGHSYRNYQLTDNVFATNDSIHNYYVNEEHTLPFLVSNISRNLSNQFGMPKVATVTQQLIENLHQLMGVDINEPKITSHTYGVDPLAIHENNGANPYHTLLMLLSMVWILITIKKQTRYMFVYWMAIVLSFVLFCFYLKWQPWAKLHVPFFIFYSVVLAHFLMEVFKNKLFYALLMGGFMIFAVLTLLFNYSRPFITCPPYTSTIKMTDGRYMKYFSRKPEYYHDYKVVYDRINELKIKNVGLMMGNYDMEYQLFIDAYRSDVTPVHLNSCEISAAIPVKDSTDCIVSAIAEDSIVYNDETYYNFTPENEGKLYLFLKK